MQVLYSLQGARGIQDLIERASKAMQADLERACRDTAFAVRRKARSNAEVIRDRGDLIASIEADGKGTSWRVGLVDRRIPSRGGRDSAHLNPSIYGVWYELGFVTRRIAASPFVNPAAESEAQAHEDRIMRAVTRHLGAQAA